MGRPTSKAAAPDAEQPPVKMRKQSGYVYFQSQHREAASAAVDIDPDTNTLGARERNQAVMKKLAGCGGALDDAAKQGGRTDDAPRVPVKERKPKAKVVKEAKPAAKAKEASPRKAFGRASPSRRRRRSRRSLLANRPRAPGRRRLFLSRACSSRSRSLRRRRRRRPRRPVRRAAAPAPPPAAKPAKPGEAEG